MKEETNARGRWVTAFRMAALAMALFLLLLPTTVSAASSRQLIPVGRAVGIKLFSDGVVVVGLSEIVTPTGTADPAGDCGLKEGDIITHINATEVDTIEEVERLLQELEGAAMSIRAIRKDRQIQLTARAVFCPEDSTYKLGAWIRDSMAGIGTVTFYDPASGTFGALGHGINDLDTSLLMPLETGTILPATVVGVKKGAPGDPGQLKGAFDTSVVLGGLTANTSGGVFGVLSHSGWVEGTPMEVARADEITTGPAVILSNIAGDKVAEYTVEITRIFARNERDSRNCLITVTDPRLLESTGGIVQGMSGSPIIQDGKLVGAVTHVLVNDPTRGYGIFIENMLDAAG